MSTLIFDLETTGLPRRGSQLHCLVIRDTDTDQAAVYDNRDGLQVADGIRRLEQASAIVGHNIINFDVPMLKELGSFDPQGEVIDTLVLSRLYYANLIERDYEKQIDGMPVKLYGRHSLEAWGHRLKCFKGEYGKQNDWSTYTPEMRDYCVQDTEVTASLWSLMQRRLAN